MIKQPFNNDASQDERRAALQNDRRVRKGYSYHDVATAEAEASRGRYTASQKSTVVGSEPVAYPVQPASSPWATDPLGLEPPLNFQELSRLEPCGTDPEIRESLQRLGEAGPPTADPNGGEFSGSNTCRLSGVVSERGSPPSKQRRRKPR